jgi:hypothetical protein
MEHRCGTALVTKQKRAGRIPDHLRSQIGLSITPRDWFAKALALSHAADLLYGGLKIQHVEYDAALATDLDTRPPIPDDSIVLVLLGFAVENLLKGLHISITGHPPRVLNLAELKVPGGRHELRPIAEAIASAELTFSPEEMALLDALEHMILWRGRYPSATHIDDLVPMYSDGRFKKFYMNFPSDHEATWQLFNKLKYALGARLK